MFKIINRKEMAGGAIIENQIEAPLIAGKSKPGQFVILKANETGERIPLTIADRDTEKGTITILYLVIGKSTRIFADLREGDFFQDVIGPLGQATHLEKYGKVLCIGGGTGIAVLHPIARGLKEAGNDVTSILGARTKDILVFEDRMRKISNEVIITTDDGSYGRKGFVTDPLKEKLESDKPDFIVAIGPVPMMKNVANITREYGVRTIVSLNPLMIDGTGMCGCCRVSVGGETKFACVDGPEFDGHLVDFDEITMRLKSYECEERESLEDHKCRLEN